ncbi:hypothetical protein J6590_056364 [Homalodisca vitripennis]|nr:hypothetical protein J6590_056364 [Homalodisca vitripennis]
MLTTRSALNIILEVPDMRKERNRHQFYYLGPKIFNSFVEFCGNAIYFETKPKTRRKECVVMQLVGDGSTDNVFECPKQSTSV